MKVSMMMKDIFQIMVIFCKEKNINIKYGRIKSVANLGHLNNTFEKIMNNTIQT